MNWFDPCMIAFNTHRARLCSVKVFPFPFPSSVAALARTCCNHWVQRERKRERKSKEDIHQILWLHRFHHVSSGLGLVCHMRSSSWCRWCCGCCWWCCCCCVTQPHATLAWCITSSRSRCKLSSSSLFYPLSSSPSSNGSSPRFCPASRV